MLKNIFNTILVVIALSVIGMVIIRFFSGIEIRLDPNNVVNDIVIQEEGKTYLLEELSKGELFRVVGLVIENKMKYGCTKNYEKRSVYNFGDSLAAGLKELGKRGYVIKDIKEISGEFWDAAITKDLLVFVEPLDKGLVVEKEIKN